MARPKSEDKRQAILDAAVEICADRGVWSTPTSAISKAAGVAEGTLFTYFATKDILANELYRTLKGDFATGLLASFPDGGDFREQFHHMWDQYVDWGLQFPRKMKIMAELNLSGKITPESRAVGCDLMARIETLLHESVRQKKVRPLPRAFVTAMMASMAETTRTYITQQTSGKKSAKAHAEIRATGFEMFWNAIAVL